MSPSPNSARRNVLHKRNPSTYSLSPASNSPRPRTAMSPSPDSRPKTALSPSPPSYFDSKDPDTINSPPRPFSTLPRSNTARPRSSFGRLMSHRPVSKGSDKGSDKDSDRSSTSERRTFGASVKGLFKGKRKSLV